MSLEEAINTYLDALKKTNYIEEFELRRRGPVYRAYVKYLDKAPKDEIPEWDEIFKKEMRKYKEDLRKEAETKLRKTTGAEVLLWPKDENRSIKFVSPKGSRKSYIPPEKFYLTFFWDLKNSSLPNLSFTLISAMKLATFWELSLSKGGKFDFIFHEVDSDPFSVRINYWADSFKGKSYSIIDKERKSKVIEAVIGETGRKAVLKVKFHPNFVKENTKAAIDLLSIISSKAKAQKKSSLERILDRFKGI